jgi:hypothetical protein
MQPTNTPADARLHALLHAVRARWGADAVQPLSHLHVQKPGLRTGFADLDARLAPAGIPGGALTLLASVPTSGMMTLVHRTLALAQGTDAYVLYIDQQGTFDAGAAAGAGMWLERLLLIRPETPLEALDLTRDLLHTEPIGALALDMGQTLPTYDGLRRLHAALAKRAPALLVLCWLADAREVAQIARLPVALRLWVERVSWLHAGDELIGCRAHVFRLAAGEREYLAEFDIRFNNGEPRR